MNSDGITPSNKELVMNIDRAVFAFAGMIILASLALAWFASSYWLILTAFVGLNLMQSAFTGFCPAAMIFRKLGLREGPAFADEAKI
jgi:hypothetical protein